MPAVFARVSPSVEGFCDPGYQGLQKLPANPTKKHPLTREQKRASRASNSRRVVVEHAIRRLKAFRLLGARYCNRRRRFDLRVNLIEAAVASLGVGDPWGRSPKFNGEIREFKIWPAALPPEAVKLLQQTVPRN